VRLRRSLNAGVLQLELWRAEREVKGSRKMHREARLSRYQLI
jgi:hypothetical protein